MKPKPFHIGSPLIYQYEDGTHSDLFLVTGVEDEWVRVRYPDTGERARYHIHSEAVTHLDGSPLGEWVPIKLKQRDGLEDGIELEQLRIWNLATMFANQVIRGEVKQ